MSRNSFAHISRSIGLIVLMMGSRSSCLLESGLSEASAMLRVVVLLLLIWDGGWR